jgi:hypothetical protein
MKYTMAGCDGMTYTGEGGCFCFALPGGLVDTNNGAARFCFPKFYTTRGNVIGTEFFFFLFL